MDDRIYEIITAFYENLNSFFPSYDGNPCENCNVCCKRIANLGASQMEKDYIREYISRNRLPAEYMDKYCEFIDFLGKSPAEKHGKTCPFFSEEIKGCSIYKARLLSCRTFGCFLNKKFESMVPDYCLIRDRIVYYDDSDFASKMPFVPDFYRMQEIYDSKKRQ